MTPVPFSRISGRVASSARLLACLLATSIIAPAGTVTNRLYIYDDIANYPWSGFMGSGNGSSLTVDRFSAESAHIGPYGIRCATSGAEDWCGVAAQCKANQWQPLPGVDLTGATVVRFDIRGASGGESVKIECMDGLVFTRPILTPGWQTITLALPAAADLTSVNNLFTVVFEAARPMAIHVDEVLVEFPRPDDLAAGSLPARVQGVGYNEIDSAQYEGDFVHIHDGMHANTLRFWSGIDFTFLTLDRAAAHGLTAIIAYWMPQTNAHDLTVDYTDPNLRAALFRSVTNLVAAHWPHPAIGALCLGNEVLAHLNPSTETNKTAFATLLTEIAIQIHTNWPGLPVTYTDVNTSHLGLVTTNAPDLDLFGSNAYGAIAQTITNYEAAGFGKPLIFLEYGCLGHWETDWSTYTDQERAEDYFGHWNLLKHHSIGGAAFTWQDKSEAGYTGWGIVNTNRTLRPQFETIAEAYAPITPPTPRLERSGRLRWDSRRGESYRIETSSSLLTNSWSEYGSAFDGTGSPLETNVTVGVESRRFFRVQIEK